MGLTMRQGTQTGAPLSVCATSHSVEWPAPPSADEPDAAPHEPGAPLLGTMPGDLHIAEAQGSDEKDT